MLAQQLRELESDNLIVRKVYPVVPPRTEYSMSDLGQTLSPILDAMCEWGRQFMQEMA
jgi:DNA-binding HxlR family transcriptional regulator